MMRFRLLILLITCISIGYGNTNESSDINRLIDSLNTLNQPKKKLELSIEIAEQLQDTDWDRALLYLELAQKEVSSIEQPESHLARVYAAMARLYDVKEVLDISLDYYLKAHELYQDLGEEAEVANIENSLAIVYAQVRNLEKASEYFRKAYAFQSKNGDAFSKAKILNNIGTYFLQNQLDSAQYYFEQSLKYTQTIQDSALFLYNYTNLARYYDLKNQTDSAISYFNKAKLVIRPQTSISEELFVYSSLSEFFSRREQSDSAIYYAKIILEAKEDQLYNFTGFNTLNLIYKHYILKEDYEAAAKYFNLYNAVRDSLNLETQVVKIERIKLQEEFKAKNKITALEQQQQKFKYLIIGLLLLVSVLVLTLILIRYKNRIQKNQLEKKLLLAEQNELKQSLESKNKTLVGKAMNEIHRTDIVNSILEELKQIKLGAAKKETQNAIDYIIKKLSLDFNKDIWKEFEVSFEQVHKNFYKNLQETHPDLTSRDRRLCAMLFLDLSTKEISLITGQDSKSVENARTRLRKKLDLTNTKENLSTYLKKLS